MSESYLDFTFQKSKNVDAFQKSLKNILTNEKEFISDYLTNNNNNSIYFFDTYLNNYLITEGYHINLTINNNIDQINTFLNIINYDNKFGQFQNIVEWNPLFCNELSKYIITNTENDNLSWGYLNINIYLELFRTIDKYILLNKEKFVLETVVQKQNQTPTFYKQIHQFILKCLFLVISSRFLLYINYQKLYGLSQLIYTEFLNQIQTHLNDKNIKLDSIEKFRNNLLLDLIFHFLNFDMFNSYFNNINNYDLKATYSGYIKQFKFNKSKPSVHVFL